MFGPGSLGMLYCRLNDCKVGGSSGTHRDIPTHPHCSSVCNKNNTAVQLACCFLLSFAVRCQCGLTELKCILRCTADPNQACPALHHKHVFLSSTCGCPLCGLHDGHIEDVLFSDNNNEYVQTALCTAAATLVLPAKNVAR
jgi:hypothetical protein